MKQQLHIDFFSIITNLLINYWYLWSLLLIITIIKSYSKTNKYKGWVGELKVNMMHRMHLNKKIYHTLKNVTLKNTNNETSQTDHIIVSIYGIFVIETKNMKGLMIGKDYEDYWTQVLNNETNPIYNPLRQNEEHIKTISERINKPENKFHSIIVFARDDCKLEVKTAKNVVLLKDYIKYIKSKTDKILTENEVKYIIEKIKEHKLPNTPKTEREHNQYVKSIKENKTINRR